ncbi:MAG TPA: DUF1501 domain-containing protein [Chthonomonadaceae bacterium]|nr:DUF1501 domain-containing protein [Chthonomonadaceae bacterium]
MWILGEERGQTCQGVTRRGLLQVGLLGAMGLSLPQLLQAQEAGKPQKAVILLWLWGGPSHLDTFDPKPDAPSAYRGPFRAIGSNVPGIQVCEYLPELAKRADRYALLRTIHHETNDHGIAGTIGLTGKAASGGRVMPSMGSVVARVKGYRPPLSSFVSVGKPLHQGHRPIQGEGGGILGAPYDPFRVEYDEVHGVQIRDLVSPEELTAGRLDRRKHFLETLDAAQKQLYGQTETSALSRSYEQAFALLASQGAKAVFELDKEKPGVRDRYGRYRFGQSCLLARRLVESGVPFVQVNWSSHVEAEEDYGDGGWDMHYRNFEIIQERHLWMLDQTLSALLDDLQQHGLLDHTLVVAMGEFGRTPKINEKAGRDHWNNCYSALLAGGGVPGGRVVGVSDARGEFPVERPIKPADVCLTIFDRLGISRTNLLALEIAPEGEVIEELA